MDEKIKVLGFAGSLRKGSYNRALLRVAKGLVPEGMELEIFELDDIPLYNGDVEEQGFPEPVQEFQNKIREVDALLVVTPEYNYSIPGVLKNAIDWASRPPTNCAIVGKPVAVTGASTGRFGTVMDSLPGNRMPMNKVVSGTATTRIARTHQRCLIFSKLGSQKRRIPMPSRIRSAIQPNHPLSPCGGSMYAAFWMRVTIFCMCNLGDPPWDHYNIGRNRLHKACLTDSDFCLAVEIRPGDPIKQRAGTGATGLDLFKPLEFFVGSLLETLFRKNAPVGLGLALGV